MDSQIDRQRDQLNIPSTHLSIHPSTHLSIHPSIHPSIFPIRHDGELSQAMQQLGINKTDQDINHLMRKHVTEREVRNSLQTNLASFRTYHTQFMYTDCQPVRYAYKLQHLVNTEHSSCIHIYTSTHHIPCIQLLAFLLSHWRVSGYMRSEFTKSPNDKSTEIG